MSTNPAAPDGQIRRCGYSQCAQELRYDGRGRPPEYCADRNWPDGRTCKQLAAAERTGERLAGLDLPLETFRAAGDRFLPAAQTLARQLLDVVEAVGQVRDGALTRVGQSERDAAAATETARAAAAAADAAAAAQRTAETTRDQARQAAAEAEDRALTTKREADERITAAWDRATAADHARGVAEAAQAAHAVSAATWEHRGQEAERRAAEAERLAALRGDEVTAAIRRVMAAEAAAETRATEAARIHDQVRASLADTEARLAQARTAAAVDAHQAHTAQQALETLRADTAAAQARAMAAEHRLDEVVTLLRTRPARATRVVDLTHVICGSTPDPAGTGLDSPYHRNPTGADLADLPLSSVADLPVVIVRLIAADQRATRPAVLPPAATIAGAAVLLHTGWDRHWGTPAYPDGAPYLTGDTARWLVDQGARLVGIDSATLDEPTAADRPAHGILLAAGVPVLVHLTGLDQVPDSGARLHAAPPRVRGSGTCPVRAYALISC